MIRDTGRGVRAPDPECWRDWAPVEEPEHRREPKREDEPVRRGDADEPGPAAEAEQADVEVLHGRAYTRAVTGGDVDA